MKTTIPLLPVMPRPWCTLASLALLAPFTLPAQDEADSEVIELEAFVVRPLEDEQGRSIRIKQSADAIGEFISSDSLGQFVDNNIGDIVERIPGLYTSGAGQSGGSGISVRGLRGDFNSLQINDARIPSNQGQTRGVSIDTVPAELIGAIEVFKALTPDREADSIGAQVNIVTKTGLDFDDRFISGNVGYGLFEIGDTPQYRFSINYADRLTEKLGIFAALSYRHEDGRQRDEINLDPGDALFDQMVATSIEETIDEDTAPLVFNPGRASVRRTLQSQSNLGLSVNLDYRADETLQFSLRTFFAEFEESRPQWRALYRFDRSDSDDPDGEEFGDRDFVFMPEPGLFYFGDDQRLRKRLADQDETELIQSYQFSMRKELDSGVFNASLTYSSSDRDLTNDEFLWEADDIPMSVDLRDPLDPRFRVLRPSDPNFDEDFNQTDLTDPFYYTDDEDGFFPADERRAQFIDAKDEIFALKADYQHFLRPEVGSAYLKAGLNYRMQEKVNNRDFVIVPDFAFDANSTEYSAINDWHEDGRIEMGLFPTWDSIREQNPESTAEVIRRGLLEVRRDDDIAESIGEDFEVTEDVFAAYLMGQYQRDRWTVLGGVRLEATSIESSGFAVDGPLGIIPDFETRSYDVSVDRSYEGVYPSIHVNYQATERLLVRASVGMSLARPSFQELFPATFVTFVNDEFRDDNDNGVRDPGEEREVDILIQRGNVELEPTESLNFDLSLEYYFRETGLISLAFFHKELENWIFEGVEFADPSDFPEYAGTDPDLDQIIVDSYFNGSSAQLSGAELSFQIPLPAGFSIQGNYTYIDISVNEMETGLDRVPGQAETLMNLGLAWESDKITARVSYFRSSEILDERVSLGDDAVATIGSSTFGLFQSKEDSWDFSFDYRATQNWTFYLQWRDFAGESAISLLNNNEDFPEDIEYEGWEMLSGVKFRF